MACGSNVQFWTEFIETYKNFPEIWKIKSETYKNRVLKEKAYHCLPSKYKELEPNATVDLLKKKINNLRACYRRELKRINQSEKSGAATEDIYVPSLWYFEQLSFLKDQEAQVAGTSSIDLEADDENVAANEEDASPPPKLKRRNYEKQQVQRNDILLRAVQYLETSSKIEDDASVFSAKWAVIFRKLDCRQQIFANKIISEVLYQGQLGKLNEYSYKALEASNICTPFSTTPTLSPQSDSSSVTSYIENAYEVQPTAHSPNQRIFKNILPPNKLLPHPQPRRIKIIPYQYPTQKQHIIPYDVETAKMQTKYDLPIPENQNQQLYQSTTSCIQPHSPEIVFHHIANTQPIINEDTRSPQPYRYDNIEDLFSDPDYK